MNDVAAAANEIVTANNVSGVALRKMTKPNYVKQ